jgi:hypothetical protein
MTLYETLRSMSTVFFRLFFEALSSHKKRREKDQPVVRASAPQPDPMKPQIVAAMQDFFCEISLRPRGRVLICRKVLDCK